MLAEESKFEDFYERTGNGMHKCTICDQESVKKEVIRNHIENIHMTKYYCCKFCKRGYKGLNNMKRHLYFEHPDLVQKSEMNKVVSWHKQNAEVKSLTGNQSADEHPAKTEEKGSYIDFKVQTQVF